MRIALLAHNLRSGGGISVGHNILDTMPRVAEGHEYYFTVPAGRGYPEYDDRRNVRVRFCSCGSLSMRALWERTRLRGDLRQFQPNWIWSLGNISFPEPPCRQSLLLQNAHRLYRSLSRIGCSLRGRLFKSLSDWQLDSGMKWVDRLYCQTDTMRRKAAEVLRYPLESIGLCPNAFSFQIQPSREWPEELEPYRGKFLLFVLTRYYPHKNLERIVEMYRRFGNRLEGTACVVPVTEDQGPSAARFIHSIAKHHLQDQIVCVPSIPQERLGQFFHACDVMFLPTLLESFSGTYLEAMHLETPILTSDRDFAREICGDAAHYIDPLSPESMTDGILRLKEDPAYRRELVQRGHRRDQLHVKGWPDIIRGVLDQENISHG
jgi:glycosyltransferase involved in cell wall biosynthesis